MLFPLQIKVVLIFTQQMLLEIGVVDNPKDVGYWSGLVESTYAISQLTTGTYLSLFAAPGPDRLQYFPLPG
jgi:hypothetical protein